MTQGKEFVSPGLLVTTVGGMSTTEHEFPDATSYVQDGNEMRVGTGEPNEYHNYLMGDTIAVFNWSNVVSITRL